MNEVNIFQIENVIQWRAKKNIFFLILWSTLPRIIVKGIQFQF